MIERFNIAGYCRISVDEELDRDNTSIENQKAIIADFVKQKFPGSTSPTTGARRSTTTCTPASWSAATVAPPCLP